ncbi:MAG: hypothetical protein V5B35_07520 [Candidatus Accumulibacter necessarius]
MLKAIECHPGDYVEAIELLANVLLNSNRNDEAWTCLNELWKNDHTTTPAILSQLLAPASSGVTGLIWSEAACPQVLDQRTIVR